jgi:1,2-diacylglycerol 3-beta-galactosyltransferase
MADPARVLVLTADAGFGHRSAANALTAALREEHGSSCVVEIVNPLEDKRVPAFVRRSQADYDRIVRETPKLYRLGYEASDTAVPSLVVESALTLMLFEVMGDLIRQHQPYVIVTTYPLYHAPLAAVFALRGLHVPLITVVTDLGTVHRLWFHHVADLSIVGTEAARNLAIEYGLAESKVRVAGIPVDPYFAHRDRGPAEIRADLGWDTGLTTLLVVGSKRVGNLRDVLRVLNHSGLPIQLAVVAGGDDIFHRRLQEIEWHVTTHLYNFVENMPTLMGAADAIVCKAGGLIVTESLASGLPMLLIDVLPGQEMGNARHVIEGGAGELADDPLDALETVYHWLDKDGALLAERANCARDLGRPGASYAIAELVWMAAQRGPGQESHGDERTRTKLVDLLTRHGVAWKGKAAGQTE